MDIWEKEAKATLEAIEAGKVVSFYKVSGQRRVVGVMDVESTDELGQILMADMPIARYLLVKEVVPIREYEAFERHNAALATADSLIALADGL